MAVCPMVRPDCGWGRDSEKDRRVFDCGEVVPFCRDDEVVTEGCFPRLRCGGETHVSVQHIQRCFVGAVVIAEAMPGREGEQRLAQVMLMTAVDRMSAPAAAGCTGRDDVFTNESGER
jgi:hypothetical protein